MIRFFSSLIFSFCYFFIHHHNFLFKMALGSELKTEIETPLANNKADEQELAHEDENNDSGHSSVNTPDASEQGIRISH